MTDAEKKMKKYVHAVERRLNLPRDVKARVMSDFASSIAARREAGQSDAEIYADLGTPEKAAGELNAQMREFAYRKSQWRYFFALLGFFGILRLLGGLLTSLLYLMLSDPFHVMENAVSVGIIGGADGPTAIFLTTNSTWTTDALTYGLILVGILGYYRMCRCKPGDDDLV